MIDLKIAKEAACQVFAKIFDKNGIFIHKLSWILFSVSYSIISQSIMFFLIALLPIHKDIQIIFDVIVAFLNVIFMIAWLNTYDKLLAKKEKYARYELNKQVTDLIGQQ